MKNVCKKRELICTRCTCPTDPESIHRREYGVAAFLEKQKPKVALFPAAKLCIEKAIKFLPKLEAGLAAMVAGRAEGPELDFGSDSD